MSIFDNVQRFRFLVNTERSPLHFNDRLVYSFLVYRYCLVKHVKRTYPTTATRIGAATGLDRRTTVSNALARLEEFGLAYRRGTGWYVREPEGATVGWFKWRSDPDARRAEWFDRFAYQWHPVPGPACGLTPRQLYLFGLYASLIAQGKPVIADKYLVKLSGLDVSTVRSARMKLFDLNLVVDAPTGWQCRPVTPHGGWFLPVAEEQAEQSPPAVKTATVSPRSVEPSQSPGPRATPPVGLPPSRIVAASTLDNPSDEELLAIYSKPLSPEVLDALEEIGEWEVEWEMAEVFGYRGDDDSDVVAVEPPGWSDIDGFEGEADDDLFVAATGGEIP